MLGCVSGILTTFAGIPQVIKVIRSESTQVYIEVYKKKGSDLTNISYSHLSTLQDGERV
jgi:hypothetical protein